MGPELIALFYVTAVGFVCAGILASLYQVMARKPAGFRVSINSWPGIFASIFICTFAGPFIIMRNAVRGRRIEHRPIGWLFGSSAIASVWSACSGVFLLNVFSVAANAMS
ncbi:hypothetical protein SAMN04488056_11338 [Cohaesibacter marisflavi]|uniref:Uncharacterized protein n=1 Tax=Cohaesibacter marisflavi TaxID=655353 RepID=A0A1I5K6A0_9HYPH|nr:hypothetical protein SAMN04488056_11338 [Cohaesibacter marisflavi]